MSAELSMKNFIFSGPGFLVMRHTKRLRFFLGVLL